MEEPQRQQFEDYAIALTDRLYQQLGGRLELLEETEQEIVRIRRMEADMYNGGFIQYFCNWGYDNFLATQKILEKIQAFQSLEILTECEKTVSNLSEDERIKELWDLPKYISTEQEARLEALNRRFWLDPDDLSLLCFRHLGAKR